MFRLALVDDVRGGAPGDVLVWLSGTPEKPAIGELWLYPASGSPRLVFGAPTFLPTGPSCSHATRLARTGPGSITLDIKATCTTPLLPRAPEHSVSVIAPYRERPLIAGFQLAAPAVGERLELDVVSGDRDGDGRDDVELFVRLGVQDDADIRARFLWLDRLAGLSRDTTEPAASFAELAALESKRASNRKSSLEVGQRVTSIRRLYASACTESGVPRVFKDSGNGLDCGSLGPVFQTLTRAGIEASLSRGEVANAFGELERHSWFPTGERADAERFRRDQLGHVRDRALRRRVVKLVPLKAPARAAEAGPQYSRLSFHADGSLLLLGSEGTVRAAPDGRFEYDASDEVDAWPTQVTSPAGERLTGLSFACERSEVAWLVSAADGSALPPVPTELSSPRPGNCRGNPAFSPPRVIPIGWSEAGVAAFVGATRVGPPSAHPPMGSALSPNGRFSIVATEWGLLVAGGEKAALWTFDDPALSPQLAECVVSNNAQAAACFLTGRPFVILPDPKSG